MADLDRVVVEPDKTVLHPALAGVYQVSHEQAQRVLVGEEGAVCQVLDGLLGHEELVDVRRAPAPWAGSQVRLEPRDDVFALLIVGNANIPDITGETRYPFSD